MSNRRENSNVSIIDAVETLSHIADLEYDQNIGVTQEHDLNFQDQHFTYRTVHWLHEKDAEITIGIVKDTFKVVLNYLKDFYKNEYSYVTDPQTIEGIKTIMVLVGEAAKKLDKYTDLFHNNRTKSVTELKEYKHLQEFYYKRIARKIDEGILGKWIYALSRQITPRKAKINLVGRKTSQTKHIFIDLEAVKKDTEYELFFLKKEDGTRFFSPRIIRNIKLVCDFGNYFGKVKGDDPLVDLRMWHDRCLHACAKNILRTTGSTINSFFHESAQQKENELVSLVSKTCMALILCSNPKNLMRNMPIKNCTGYFKDFEVFLRRALHSTEYQRLIAYPPEKSNKLANSILEVIHALCSAFFTSLQGYQEIADPVHHLIEEANQEISPEHIAAANNCRALWSKLAAEYVAMVKLVKRHPNGPLINVLNILQEGEFHAYDPLFQNNIPNQLYSLYYNDDKILNIRMPAPIYQESIHKASVVEEFKGFLRASEKSSSINKYLLFNFQDRTSWREYSRCIALEDLQKIPEFEDRLVVVTMAKDTEFYHQLAPYQEENHADIFMKNLKNQLRDENSGFYFPEKIKKILLGDFIDGVVDSVKRIFFSDKNVLLKEHRLVFIDIVLLFIQLKIMEIVQPDAFSLACKDGIDGGCIASAQTMVFIKLLNKEHFSDEEVQALNLILFAPSILIRERVVVPERFNRFINLIKTIEAVKDEMGVNFSKVVHEAFGHFFKTPILQAKIVLPKLVEIE